MGGERALFGSAERRGEHLQPRPEKKLFVFMLIARDSDWHNNTVQRLTDEDRVLKWVPLIAMLFLFRCIDKHERYVSRNCATRLPRCTGHSNPRQAY